MKGNDKKKLITIIIIIYILKKNRFYNWNIIGHFKKEINF